MLLSSHLLREVEQVADDLVLIGDGRIVGAGRQGDPAGREPDRARSSRRSTRPPWPPRCPPKAWPPTHAGEGLRVEATPARGRHRRRPALPRPLRPEPRRRRSGVALLRAHRRHLREPVPDPGRGHVMTAQTITPPRTLDVSGTPVIPFGRLVSVEVRKMVDTRAGRWLLISTGLVTALVLVPAVGRRGQDLTVSFGDFMVGMNTPMGVFLPVLGIMAVTQEFGQRTALTTFTQVPSRLRVFGAKFVATLGLAVVAVVVGLLLAFLANVLYGALSGSEAIWGIGVVRRRPLLPAARARAGDRASPSAPCSSTRRWRSSSTSSTPSCCRGCSGSAPRSSAGSPTSSPWVDFNFAQEPPHRRQPHRVRLVTPRGLRRPLAAAAAGDRALAGAPGRGEVARSRTPVTPRGTSPAYSCPGRIQRPPW